MANEKFSGIPFLLNGERRIVPALSLKQFRENLAVLTADIPAGEGLDAQVDRFMPVILLAVQRNYPDITLENLNDWLDMSNFREMYLAVQGASGLKAVAPGE